MQKLHNDIVDNYIIDLSSPFKEIERVNLIIQNDDNKIKLLISRFYLRVLKKLIQEFEVEWKRIDDMQKNLIKRNEFLDEQERALQDAYLTLSKATKEWQTHKEIKTT